MEQETTAIIIAIFTLVLLGLVIITLFIIFQKRKNALLLAQKEAKNKFETEISKTQIEIREETFRNISWELHDNIGQLLTLAKIQLQNASNNEEVKSTLDKALKELRTISKIINPEYLNKISLAEAIELEIERLNRIKFINSSFRIEGRIMNIDKEAQIIFFRIFQEFVSNTIKHAKATDLKTNLKYLDKELIMSISDNGKGFELEKNKSMGIGLLNIKNRAELIKAEAQIESEIDGGTSLTLTYPIES